MSPPQPDFDKFYSDRIKAQRQFYTKEQLDSRWTRPSVVISALLVVVTLLVNVPLFSIVLRRYCSYIATLIWDCFVYVFPTPLLNLLEKHFGGTQADSPMTETSNDAHAAKSDRMRRILGLNRTDGFMGTVFRARTRALSATGSVFGFKADSDRPAGLGNMDNSCYQNSILQGFASLEPLPGYLTKCRDLLEIEEGDRAVAQTLRTLIADLNDVTNNGKTLWTPSLLKSMSTWTQQDAQEYFSKILDDIDKGVAKAVENVQEPQPGFVTDSDDRAESLHSEDSGYQSCSSKASEAKKLRNPLEGLLAQRVACVQCGYAEGLSMIPFNCLTLSLGLDNNQHDLYERLDSYTNIEAIEGVHCPKCTLLKAQRLLQKLIEMWREKEATPEQLEEPLRRLEAVELALEEDDFEERTISEKCKITAQSKVNTTKTKQIVIARPPQSLAIHMNRSVFDPSTFQMMKNSAPVSFPLTLDLGPWCLGSAYNAIRPTDENGTSPIEGLWEQEEWLSDPRKSMVAGDQESSKLTGPIYELRAAVTHYGRHENGHYICYRRHYRPAPTSAQSSKELDLSVDGTEDQADVLTANGSPGDDVSVASSNKVNGMDWWRLSDHNVTRVDEETVLGQSPGVFMLFYDCIDPDMLFETEPQQMHEAGAAEMLAAVSTSDEICRTRDDSPGMDSCTVDGSDTTAMNSPRTLNDVRNTSTSLVPVEDGSLRPGSSQPSTPGAGMQGG